MTEEHVQRRLAAILAADVVGYSALMSNDEEATLRTLRDYRAQFDGLIEKHNGRIFNTAGDSVLAEFGSPVEAVRCAISAQEDFAVRNAELTEEMQMWFRIGINVGDVMVDNGDLFGDGVNVAARLEGLAEKGGICISGSTFEQVKNKLSIAFDDIGPQSVKNIPEPVPAFRLVPGKIALNNFGTGRKRKAGNKTVGNWRLWIFLTGAAAVIFGGAYYAGLIPNGWLQPVSFDGQWRVTVSSLAGCASNNTRSFRVDVVNGKIEERSQRFPKLGTVSPDGRFDITAVDGTGNVVARQTGKISGDKGEGQFQGRRPTCNGTATLTRIR